MLKKALLSLMLMVLCFAFFGCVSIDASVKYTSKGQIVQQININFNSDSVEYLERVQVIVQEEVDKMEAAYNAALYALANSESAANLALYLSVSLSNEAKVNRVGNSIVVVKEFDNVRAYMFYNYRDREGWKIWPDMPIVGEAEEVGALFTVQLIQEAQTLFGGQEALITQLSEKVNERLGRDYVVQDDVNLIFQFITPFRRIHSDGQVVQVGQYYHHVWNITDPNTVINIWRTIANPLAWYILGLSLVLTGLLVVGICFYVRDRKLKKAGYVDATGKSVQELAEMLMQLSNNNVSQIGELSSEEKETKPEEENLDEITKNKD
jgi:hypothetical protein